MSPAGAEIPEPYAYVTWTATGKGSSDDTDPDGSRQTAERAVEMSGFALVRRYSDGSQDALPFDLTVHDDIEFVSTQECVNGGVTRSRQRLSIIDPDRYKGPETVPHVYDPSPHPDGTWRLQDPFSGFYQLRFFTYRDQSDSVDCEGAIDRDVNELPGAAYNQLGFPGELSSDDGVTFFKKTEFDQVGNPPLTVEWNVTVRLLRERDLTVERVEVTQGLQSYAGRIPLVRGRRTVVRAYIGIGKQPGPVEGVTGQVTAYAGLTPLGTVAPFNPGGRISAPDHPDWKKIDDTLNFELLHAWTLQPSLRLVVKVNPDFSVDEDNYLNNELETSKTTTECQDVNVGYVPIHYDPPGVPGGDPGPGIRRAHEFLRKLYPVAEGELKYAKFDAFRFGVDVFPYTGLGGYGLLDVLRDRLLISSQPRPDRVVGWLPTGVSDAEGLADMPGVSSWVLHTESPPIWRGDFAHELGHNYGRDHTDETTNGHHWFDVYERKIKPPPAGETALIDFMHEVAHPEPEQWVSPDTYRFLFGKICGGAAAQSLEARTADVGDNVLVSGIVQDGVPVSGSLDPLFRLSNVPTHVPDPPSAGPGYCVKLKNASGSLLAQYCFDAFFVRETPSPAGTLKAPFGLVVPYPAGLARVELTRGTSALLSFRLPSANPPAVTLTYPNAPGLTLSGTQTVTWTGTDPDGNPLTYNLLYSSDGGASWKGVGVGITGTSHPLDFSQLPGGAVARIRVQASDGFHTAEDTSDNAFAVGNKAPTAAIVSPPSGQTFEASLPVTLQGEGSDLEDGSLGNAALSWSSSKDGALGTGQLLEKLLTPGVHVITLTGTDSNGLTAADTVSLTVTGSPPPAPGFYTVTPCRVADTRDPAGPWGGPALSAGTQRVFAVASRCGISPTARAVSFNFTVTQPAALGHLSIYPGGTPLPLVSVINFAAGQTRANNAIVPLGADGSLAVYSGQPSGTTHFIIDVNGYFE